MLLHFRDYGPGFTLGEEKELDSRNEKLEDIIYEEFPEYIILVNDSNEIEFLDYYFVGDIPISSNIDLFKNFVGNLPIKGLYTVPELNLENVTFNEVLKAVKDYFLQEAKEKRATRV